MSSRSFLYGLGSGLIVAALFIWVVPQSNQQVALTQDQLKAMADQKQLVLVPKAEYEQLKKADSNTSAPVKSPVTPSTPQTQIPKQPTADGAASATQPQKPVDPASTKQETSKSPVATTAPKTPDAATPTPQDAQVSPQSPAAGNPTSPAEEVVSVRIPGATNATSAGQLMVDAGLIQSADQLVNALRAANKLDRIRASTYQIPKGTSIDDIVKQITTPPKK